MGDMMWEDPKCFPAELKNTQAQGSNHSRRSCNSQAEQVMNLAWIEATKQLIQKYFEDNLK